MTWRHEQKHYINTADWLSLRHRLKSLMQPDRHADANGEYHIRSLYFENFDNLILKEKIEGLNHRVKFRIRIYDHDPSTLRLERKTRRNGMGCKESIPLTPDQCLKLMEGDTSFVEETGTPLLTLSTRMTILTATVVFLTESYSNRQMPRTNSG